MKPYLFRARSLIAVDLVYQLFLLALSDFITDDPPHFDMAVGRPDQTDYEILKRNW